VDVFFLFIKSVCNSLFVHHPFTPFARVAVFLGSTPSLLRTHRQNAFAQRSRAKNGHLQ
jgi:hypothetical protein